jgi:hypothetical protein
LICHNNLSRLLSVDPRTTTLSKTGRHIRCEAVCHDHILQLGNRNLGGVKVDEEQIQVLFRFQLPFPFVFHRIDTVKLYQSLFDLVRSVASQNLKLLIHASDTERHDSLLRNMSLLCNWLPIHYWICVATAGREQRGR